MRELLSAGGMGLVILGEILRDLAGLKDSFAAVDLKTQEGVYTGVEMQGQIKGLNRVIDRIFEIAEGIEE